MPSFGPLRLALSPPPRPCGPGCSTLSPLPARFRLPVLGPLSLSPPMRYRFPHHFAPAAGSRASSSLRHPTYPLETSLDTFSVLRQKGAVFSACCAVSRALHLSKVLLSQLGFHRVHILSLAFRHRSRWRASVYRSSVSLCIYVGGFPPPQRSGLRIRSALRPRSRLGIPDRLRRSGGRRRLALASPGFTHARGTGEPPQRSCHLHGSQPLLALLATLSVCLR